MADTPSTPPAPSDSSAEANALACRAKCRERLNDIRDAQERLRDLIADDRERNELELTNELLEIQERRQLKLLLSWGGPSDGFVLTFDKTGQELIEGVYFHADWFAYAEERLPIEEAEMVMDFYLAGDPSAYFSTAA